ncbi:MAG: HlyD family efflux transporter periplasmic adaptor subunit [Phycisphaerales bacterium]
MLEIDGGGEPALLAVHPPVAGDPEFGSWLDRCVAVAEKTLTSGAVILSPVNGDPGAHAVVAPLRIAGRGPIVTAVFLRPADRNAAEATRQLLELMAGVVAMCEQHLAPKGLSAGAGGLDQALGTLAAVNCQSGFLGVAMAFCNEVAARWRCERVSLGFLRGRYVQVRAMSHTEQFSRKMTLVQEIEAAMEECLDQDCEILYPSQESACIARAAGELSGGQGGKAILSLPLRYEGKPYAVVTLERGSGEAFNPEEVEAVRLACDLGTPRLVNLHQYDRWFGARAVAAVRNSLATVVGPQYTWVKLAAVAAFAVLLFVFFARGWYRIKAPFVVEAISQYKIAAPFDGFLKSVDLEVGDSIEKALTALAELDTAELRLELAAARAEEAKCLKQSDAAMRDGKTAEAQIAQADADKARAQIDLLAHRIEQARILSPVTGTLVTGDLRRQIGAPVQTGQILFEVAPLDSLRAQLYVAEDEVLEMVVGQEGKLATATYPGQYIPFVVERINPAAEVVNSRNVFKVRARLLESRPWLRPGMEGVAKVAVQKRPYAWIWSRKVVNWIRMKLWI